MQQCRVLDEIVKNYNSLHLSDVYKSVPRNVQFLILSHYCNSMKLDFSHLKTLIAGDASLGH